MDIYEAANKMKYEQKNIFDLKLRVTFYARVSTTKEEQENSIENQITYFTDFIKNNKNWTYVEGYVDRVRGEYAVNRVNFMRMIEDGKAGVFDLVLTKEVSRFARNTIDSLTYTRELLRAGVGVFFQNDNICTIDTDSELRLTIMSSIAADEVRKLSERVRWGHKRAIESGNVMGNNRIFGYDKKDCKLVINESEAEMVRLIFEEYATGKYSVRKIEDILYNKGYRGRNGTRIHHNTISGIIQNPKYKGYYCGNKVKIIDYRTKEQRFLPEDEWVMYKDETGEIVPAIVSEELWDKCNEIFKARSAVVKSRERSLKDKSVFTGKIFCAADDKAYWRTSYSNSVSKGKPIYQWICSEKRRFGAKACASFSILESDLYQMLSEHFKDIAENIEDYVDTFLKIYREADTSSTTQKELDSLRARLEKEKAKREKLLDAYTEDLITKAEFKERNDASNITINDLEEEIYAIEKKAAESDDYVRELEKIEKYFKEMYSPDRDMTREEVDEMVLTIIDRINVIPRNEECMKLEIKLKTGANRDVTYVRGRNINGCRSGHICKKMIDNYKQGLNG
ncbi:recombinase family protein [Huintestinicola sp.]|uniref:recombinase family protein n=1 Tax=Huintestinicola sp. TaxID=2981661 RepID=UPI003D7E34CA